MTVSILSRTRGPSLAHAARKASTTERPGGEKLIRRSAYAGFTPSFLHPTPAYAEGSPEERSRFGVEKKPVRSKDERIRLRPSKRLCPSLRPAGVLQPSTEACLPPCAHLIQTGAGAA